MQKYSDRLYVLASEVQLKQHLIVHAGPVRSHEQAGMAEHAFHTVSLSRVKAKDLTARYRAMHDLEHFEVSLNIFIFSYLKPAGDLKW